MGYQRGEAQQGSPESEAALKDLFDATGNIDGRMEVMILGTIAYVTGNLKLLDLAEASATRFARLEGLYNRYLPGWESCVLACLGLVAATRGDMWTAQCIDAKLATEPSHWTWLCSPDRVRGLLARTTGNLDQAAAHFEDALAFCSKAGYRPELAWASYDFAHTLLQRDATGDNPKATSLLEKALTISTELGMRPLMERVAAPQEHLHTQPKPTPVYPDGLTEREVEILRLVAAGKSNPEIAEALYISPRTVSTHISNILNKVDAANRVEATTYALRRGLA